MKTMRLLQLLVVQVHAQALATQDNATEQEILADIKRELEQAEEKLEQAS